jgi:PAS domain S-box-containing protein
VIPRHPAAVNPWVLVVTFALLAGGILAAGALLYRSEREHLLGHERAELDAVAAFKVQQLAAWRREREAGLARVPSNSFTAEAVAEFLARPADARGGGALRAWLEALRRADNSHAAFLVDAAGEVKLASNGHPHPLSARGRAAALEAMRTGRVMVTDLELDQRLHRAHLDLAAPFFRAGGGPAPGAVLLCVDPDASLYPMAQAWPTPSPSAETLLVRREGDDVLFLNELRHRPGTALRLRHPAAAAWLPAAMAVRGQTGIVAGVDYRGVPVLAAVRPVPGSPWFVVAKIDAAEVTAPLRARAGLVLALVLALLVAAGGGVGLVWRQQQARFFQREYEAQRERQALLRRYEQLTRQANDIIILASPAGRILEVNDRAVQAYGYDRAELLGLDVRDLRAPETLADLAGQQQAADDRGGAVFETRHRRRSGETFPVEVSLQTVVIDGEQLRFGVIRDTSERRRAEAALREGEARLAATLHSIGDGVIATDAAGHLTLMNPVAEALSGWTLAAARGRPLGEILHLVNEGSRARLEDPAARVLREGRVVGLANHTLLVARDGAERPIADSGAPIRDAAGAVAGVVLVFRDQTEERRHEAALRERDERYQALFDRSLDSIYLTDLEGRFRDANAAALGLLGYAREEIAALTLQSLLSEDQLPLAIATMQEIAATGSHRGTPEFRLRAKDGSIRLVESRASAVYRDGQPVAVLGIARDITERKRVETELERSRLQLAEAMDLAHLANWEFDALTGTFTFDDRFYALYGTTAEREGGPQMTAERYSREFLHPDDQWMVAAEVQKALAATDPGYEAHIEHRIVRRDGVVRHLVVRFSITKDASGRTVKTHGANQDITARKQAEEALRESERRFRDVLETVQLVAVTLDAQGRITFCNDYLAALLGWPRQELLGRDWFETCLPAAVRDEVRGVFHRCVGAGDFPAHYTNDIVTRDGARRTVAWNNTVLRDPGGAVVGTSSLGEDITERLQAENALRQSEERYRTLASQAPVGIFQLDRQANLVFANERWFEMVGLTPEQAAGHGWLASVHPEDRAAVEAAWRGGLARGGGFDVQNRFVTPRGRVIWALGSGAVLRTETGAVVGTLGFVTDITEQRAMQARLLQADRMVSVGTLAAGVAHEINNPLAYVVANLGYAVDELRRAPSGAAPVSDVIEALVEAQEGADRVRRIVRDLKVFSRADEERQTMVSVEALLESSISMAANEIRHRAQLVRDFGGVPAVRANDARLGQVFLNLLVNAAQAIPEGHAEHNQIRVATRTDDAGRVVVAIGDTGCGIPPAVSARIFDPFYTTKPIGEGTGLGLAICQSIVTALGGEIQVESEVGVGTTFRVVLPVGVAPAAADEPVAAPQVAVRRGRILLIDDEAMVARAVKRMLALHHEVEIELQAPRALARLVAGEQFDVVLCDLMMPEMTGMDLYHELQLRVPAAIPRLVFLTGGAFTPAAREFLEQIPNRRLEKPVDSGLLGAAIADILA